MTGSFECVLFDFGGVFTASPFRGNAIIAEELGVETSQITELMFGSYSEDTDHPWHRLERGEISLEQTRNAIIGSALEQGLEFEPLQVLVRSGGGGATHQFVVDKVRTLRHAGYRTAMVTNNVIEFRDHWRSMIPVDELFELIVDSSEVGVRKPSPEIFHIALGKLGLSAEQCVFLDDFEGNVSAAESLGIRSVLVGEDPSHALVELDGVLAGQ